ncbi:MAG: PilZ domain-containing protein [Pontixanthobacter sp.]
MTVIEAPSGEERKIRRKYSRLHTELPVFLRTISGYQPCVMLDLSLTGMKLRFARDCYFAEELRYGSGAELIWNDFTEYGEFIWIAPLDDSYNAGIQFFEPIERQVIFATRDLHDDFWAKGGFKTAERQVARRWVQGMY